MNRRLTAATLAATLSAAAMLTLMPPSPAAAAITCASDAGYAVCGRVFPDPEAGLGTDPWAEGALPAGDFIEFGEPGGPGGSQIWDGLTFLESRYGRFMDVWRLDELLDEPDALSAGLWLGGEQRRFPLIMVRVTDETVPAEGKQRFVFGLSLHGIERAGAEGGTRAIEDLVTYAHCESLGSLEAARADAACAAQTHVKLGDFQPGRGGFPARLLPWDPESSTMGETLRRTELYFTYNNPDGWRRGDKIGGIGHHQRYNGSGVDPNRDWPTVGYTYWPYTPGSEPETKHFARALLEQGEDWASGIDLHGMTGAPVLTYTMLPAGQHDFRKNARIREIAEQTQTDAEHRLTWSPLIAPRDEPRRGVDLPILGSIPQMHGQQWGTVWDTINYTVTGAFGDWINSPIGLNAIGMNNEMAWSHITNCGVGSCFIPALEQLHVAGNKGLIYSDIDITLRSDETEYRFPFRGRAAYLAYDNTRRHPGGPVGFSAITRDLPVQDPIAIPLACPFGCFSDEWVVHGPDDGVLNRGMTVNIGFLGTHSANDPSNGHIELQRFEEDPHDEDHAGWVSVGRHYNQSQLYLSNGATIAVNDPPPGRYRLFLSVLTPGPYMISVAFHDEGAYTDPGQLPYEATQFRFFDELQPYLLPGTSVEPVTTEAILADAGVLDPYDVVVLSDDPLHGWDEERPRASSLSRAQRDRYYTTLRRWVRDGGTLVLLDGALRGLEPLVRREMDAQRSLEYAGWMSFHDGQGTTWDDPLARDTNPDGAAEGSGNRKQTYEPVPLGYSIDEDSAPVWTVARDALDGIGGRTVATTRNRPALGEVPLGEGVIRFAGGLLPPPTQDFDHPFGLADHALTYTGWQVFENLLQPRVTAAAPAPAPRTPEVLGTRTALPATGFVVPLLALLALLPFAAWGARRLRDTPWV